MSKRFRKWMINNREFRARFPYFKVVGFRSLEVAGLGLFKRKLGKVKREDKMRRWFRWQKKEFFLAPLSKKGLYNYPLAVRTPSFRKIVFDERDCSLALFGEHPTGKGMPVVWVKSEFPVSTVHFHFGYKLVRTK